jgi:predicted nucleic acid-binding protein
VAVTLDSAFVIDLMRGAARPLSKARSLDASGEPVFLTAPVLCEVLSGILHRQSRTEGAAFQVMASRYPVVSFGERAARRAADIRGEFMRLGRAKPGVDVMIAGIALEYGYRVITRDSDFGDISSVFGLMVEGY